MGNWTCYFWSRGNIESQGENGEAERLRKLVAVLGNRRMVLKCEGRDCGWYFEDRGVWLGKVRKLKPGGS